MVRIKLLVASIVVLGLFSNRNAMADESAKKAPTPKLGLTPEAPTEKTGGGGAADLINVTHFSNPSDSKKPGVTLTAGCVDAAGHPIGPDSPNYNTCVGDTHTGQFHAPNGAQPKPNAGIKFGN